MTVVVARLVAIVLALAAALPARADFDINQVENSVVRVITAVERDGKILAAGHGTGFVINDRGNVVTNHHVITPPKLPRGVTLKGFFVPDGSFDTLRTAKVIWSSEALDLAVLEVANLDRPALSLAEVEPESGDEVWPVGFPGVAENFVGERSELLNPTVSNGVVGKMLKGGNPKQPETVRRLVQHGAALNPGNSGGPLFNACNQVVGVNTFGAATVLPVKRLKDGKFVASGPPPAGVFFSSHVSVLMKEMQINGIPFLTVGERCVPTAAGGTPFNVYLLVAVVALFAAAAMVLSLRRPRERVVRVVETYSQMLRRKGTDSAPPPPHRERPRRDHAADAAPPAVGPKTSNWQLTGADGAGNKLRFSLSEGDQGKDGNGIVLGRSRELCDRVVEDTSVSRRHVRLVASAGGLTIEDLSSSNGTAVDGRKLTPYEPSALAPGMMLTLGDVSLTVSTG